MTDERLRRPTLNITETAKVLGVSRPVAARLTHRADFPAFRVGGRVLISAEGLREWIRKQANSGGDTSADQ